MAELPPLPADPLADEVRGLAERLRLGERARAIDRDREFPRTEFRALGEARMLGLHVPPRLGGRGLPLPRVGTLLFHLAYHGGTAFAKLSLQPEFCAVLADHGAPEIVDEWFRPMMRGERLVGNQMTEPGAGSDAAAIGLRAERTPEGYRLTGTKSEVAFATEADAAIVYGRCDAASKGISAYLVPQDRARVERELGAPDLGERWQRRGTVRYAGATVPRENLLGPEGAGLDLARAELVRERALLASIYLGVARASWDETVLYVEERRAFGRTLREQEAVAFPLVEDGAALEAARLYVDRALENVEAGRPADAITAMAKWLAVEAALRTLDHAIQFHGGRGYSGGLPHERRWRDVRSGAIAHGPSEVMHLVAARHLWPKPRP
ncbi:MAG TPA: acyl-CoA dehydrogenase family protein [Thermoplasmata archaeon]|nr:acyl-CoA dehydrogenase family protein [Thermoplasmata archaeon]